MEYVIYDKDMKIIKRGFYSYEQAADYAYEHVEEEHSIHVISPEED